MPNKRKAVRNVCKVNGNQNRWANNNRWMGPTQHDSAGTDVKAPSHKTFAN